MAAEREDDTWLTLQHRREERMRFEVLTMLFEAANRCVDLPIDVAGFVRRLGVWEDELDRVLGYLARYDYIRFSRDPAGQRVEVCLTVKGVDYIERDAGRRRTIRD
jgi:hypothetical protein